METENDKPITHLVEDTERTPNQWQKPRTSTSSGTVHDVWMVNIEEGALVDRPLQGTVICMEKSAMNDASQCALRSAG